MRARLLKVLTLAGLTAGIGAGVAASAGPTPGFAQGGVAWPNGQVLYTALASPHRTVVEAIRIRDNHVLHSRTLHGLYGVPLVAYDGTAGGLTRDGKQLVLETAPGKASTRFTVLRTANFSVQQSFSLPGTWAFDALSPEGNTLYLIQILPSTDTVRYLVRAYDLRLHQLVSGAIADKRETGAMTGYPLSRVTSSDGTWAYTLYQRGQPGAKPFIHALNTRDRVAVCIDLDWPGNANNLGDVRLTLSPDEQQLVIRRVGDGKALMTVPAPS